MENKKAPSFIIGIIAIILGWTLFKHFDFKNLSFQKPWLDGLYLIVFILSVYIWLKTTEKEQKNK